MDKRNAYYIVLITVINDIKNIGVEACTVINCDLEDDGWKNVPRSHLLWNCYFQLCRHNLSECQLVT